MGELETEDFFARRTESVDASGIASLVQRRTETVFGRINVEYIIERANLGISLVSSESGEILAHVSLLDYPSVGTVDQAHWEQWTGENFTDEVRASPMNSLFLHLFVAKEGFHQAAITETLRIAFVAVPVLQYIILTTASAAGLGSALQTHFSAWPVIEGRSPSHLAYVTHRHQHFPVLHVRPARVEDTDDLMPIFRQYAHDITTDYGDYFLAELIESQDCDHKTFVAEVGGHAVGFISVTTKVDLRVLSSCFQLEAYHDLRHPAPLDQAPTESGLVSHSVQSIATSEHLQGSSTSIADATNPADPAPDSAPQPQSGGVVSSGSQDKLSSSSLTRLAQIAQMTSSKSRLTQSKSKLATTSHTKASTLTQSRTAVTASKTKVADSKTTATDSKTKVADSKTTATDSKTKVADSKTTVADSKTTMSPPEAKLAEAHVSQSAMKATSSTSPARPNQSGSGYDDGLSSTNMDRSQSGGEGEGLAPPTKPEKSVTGGKTNERAHRLAGQSNAVAVQLFAIHDQYEMRSVDLLEAVFQAFPDHDFCLLSLPHTIPVFPLLSNFMRVPPRVHCTLPQELYVLHKCSLLHSFLVRPAVVSDLPGVKELVCGLEGSDCVMGDVVRSVEGGRDGVKEGATPLSAMVAECANQIVGVAVIRREEELLYLYSHYNVEDFVYLSHHRPEEHGRLHHLVLSPAFSPLTKHFMKEVMRQCHVTCLYYPLHPSLLPPAHPHKPHTITSALAEMVPVRSRRQIVYPQQEVLGVNQPLPQVTVKRDQPFTLYHINRKLTLEPKTVINSRVVVVGSSDTSLSLLEALVFSPHLAFNNLLLVSPNGLPSSSALHLPNNCCYWPSSLSQMGLGAWLHVVHASMVAIRREEKEVVVWREEEGDGRGRGEGEGEEGVVPYDHLILCTGLQFTPPPIVEQCGEIPLIYDANEGLEVAEWAEKSLDSKDCILLYGCSLEAYTALHSLLVSGVAPEFITFAQPHPPTCFNNPTVEQRVQRSLEETGVVLLLGHTLSGIQEGGACLVKEEESVLIECQALVCMEDRQVSPRVFTALNDACLVFDKRLVVDSHYHTNDSAILAAGPMAKFSRQYYADQWTPANFNSKEVGQKLAASLLSQLDLTSQPSLETDVNSDPHLLPSYTQPKSVHTILPGGLHYLHVEKPNLGERLDSLMRHTSYGKELVTDADSGYFRLHINQYSRVQTITVLSHQAFETSNYLCLYNLHEKYLNNVLSRYEEGLISDFFMYFREPWACAVFHDRFPDLREEVKELLSQPVEGDDMSVEQKVRDLLKEQQTVSLEDHKEQLLSDFSSSSVKPSLQQLLHRYLHYNHYHLPVYAHPDIL